MAITALVPLEARITTLNAIRLGIAAPTALYVGLGTNQSNTPADDDTGANIAARALETDKYSGGSRPQWIADETPATTDSLSNSASKASFTFTEAISIWHIFGISTLTINDVAGKLSWHAVRPTAKVFEIGDIYDIQATTTIEDGGVP